MKGGEASGQSKAIRGARASAYSSTVPGGRSSREGRRHPEGELTALSCIAGQGWESERSPALQPCQQGARPTEGGQGTGQARPRAVSPSMPKLGAGLQGKSWLTSCCSGPGGARCFVAWGCGWTSVVVPPPPLSMRVRGQRTTHAR